MSHVFTPNSKTILVLELNASHVGMMGEHLITLNSHDRRFRFGMQATDEVIRKYVDSFNFKRDCFFGVIDNFLKMVGMAHLAYPEFSNAAVPAAEFGFSVSEKARGLGIGNALFARSAMHARNTHIQILYVQYLSKNAAMLHIARKAGMLIENESGESEAFLRLPPSSPRSLILEAMQDQSAIIDYYGKQGAKKRLIRKDPT